MEIKSVKDVKLVSDIMHDSEFEGEDFGFNSAEKIFFLNSRAVTMKGGFFFQKRSPIQQGKRFHLEFWNVMKYNPINLDKILAGKGIGGVFNYIKIRKQGKRLTIVSQDLRIELELSELKGRFDEINEREQLN